MYPATNYGHTQVPQIHNPFAPSPQGANNGPQGNDELAEWMSTYNGRPQGKSGHGDGAASAGGANALPVGARVAKLDGVKQVDQDSAVTVDANADGKKPTVLREGGGQKWQDASLLEWDPTHHRLFIGNLAGEVTDESLYKAFSKYTSLSKARVIRDKKTTKSKGYGFVSFATGDDYFAAAKEMAGKYIGSHPIQIRRSNTEIKVYDAGKLRKHNGKQGGKYNKQRRDKDGDKNEGGGADSVVSQTGGAKTAVAKAGVVKAGGAKAGGAKAHGVESAGARSVLHANTGAGIRKHPKTKNGMKLLG
ncbi:RNA-binding domain-containing protein [Aulographum hederae CBS 113979]|uniref:RNA-binding domain-containing protein n=1 Tax=Aulographum hederae CBS 113979 TaxID=1176131 RepID=A0A6G1GS21_9PEZI|nr:RNA-binding domain-containing protein [Aulographum hederae CBS 113979]